MRICFFSFIVIYDSCCEDEELLMRKLHRLVDLSSEVKLLTYILYHQLVFQDTFQADIFNILLMLARLVEYLLFFFVFMSLNDDILDYWSVSHF